MTLDEYIVTRPHGDLEATRLVQIIREMEQEEKRLLNMIEVLEGAYRTADRHRVEWRMMAEDLEAFRKSSEGERQEALKGFNDAMDVIRSLQKIVSAGVLVMCDLRDRVLLARCNDDEIVSTLNRMITELSEVCDV